MTNTDDTIYEEHVPSHGLFLILLSVTVLIGAMTYAQLTTGPVGDDPAPTALLAAMTAIFAFTALNYRRVTVRVTTSEVVVGYGVFRSRRRITDIVAATKAVKPWYFGFGLRFIPYKGRGAWMYNAIGVPNVAIETREGGPRPLLTATRDPDALVRAIETART